MFLITQYFNYIFRDNFDSLASIILDDSFILPLVNLTKLEKMKKLQMFNIQTCNKQYLQQHNLIYAPDTFDKLTNLKEIRINIPLLTADFSTSLYKLPNLKTFDLCGTSWVGMANISKAVHAVNKNVDHLFLNNFQPMGRDMYNGTLSFPEFFGPENIFPNLTILTLRENSLVTVLPSISVHAPVLEVLDISGNMIINIQNTAVIIESLLHPTLICFFAEQQGVVGFDSQMFYNMTLKYKHCLNKVTHGIPSKELGAARKDNGMTLTHEDTSSHKSENLAPLMKTPTDKPFVFLPANHVVACANEELKDPRANISALFLGSTYSQQFFLYKLLHCVIPDMLAFQIPLNIIPPLQNIYNPDCLMLVNIPLGKNLRNVDYSHQQWENALYRSLAFEGNLCFAPNGLRNFDFSENSNWIKPYNFNDDLSYYTVKGLDSINTFDFSNNHMTFDIKGSPQIFPNIKRLYLTGNNLTLHPNTEICIFLKKLEYLYLDNCNLKVYDPLPKDLLMGCSTLKVLHLGMNDLTSSHLQTLDFTRTNNIQLLNLTGNDLTTLSPKFMSILNSLTSKMLTLDLSDNHLVCTCDNRVFIEWLTDTHRHYNIQIHNIKEQTCMRSNNQLTNIFDKSLPVSPLNCHVAYKVSLAILGCILLLIVLLFLYKMRWRLRYKVFKLKEYVIKLFKCFSSSKDAPANYLFDAYVAYVDDDLFWICHSLLKVLETQYSFALCIKERNFMPGYTISELISSAIDKSRDVIIVLGRNSMNQEWFNFEWEQAILKMNNTGRKPIIVTMKNFQSAIENSVAAGLLDAHEYLEWEDDAHAQKLFWQRMTNKLFSIEAGCCNCVCCPFYSDIKQSPDSSALLRSEDCDGFCNLN